jgi:branched-subunit amino acid aminotransferase/4-amino-4-deoxychorismate lyase
MTVGLFETIRARHGVAFRLDDHLARLRRSASRFGLRLPRCDLPRVIRTLCAKKRLDDACIRIVLTDELAVTASPMPPPPPSGRVRIASWFRDPRSPFHGHKLLGAENRLIRDETRAAGYAETLFADPRGNLLEGSVTNLFLVKNGALVTPGLQGILPGVTRQVVLELAAHLGIPVRLRSIRRRDLLSADAVFLTNALLGIFPVTALARTRLRGPGPIVRLLCRAYHDFVADSKAP